MANASPMELISAAVVLVALSFLAFNIETALTSWRRAGGRGLWHMTRQVGRELTVFTALLFVGFQCLIAMSVPTSHSHAALLMNLTRVVVVLLLTTYSVSQTRADRDASYRKEE